MTFTLDVSDCFATFQSMSEHGFDGFESRHSRHFQMLEASETRRFRGFFYVPVTAGSAIRARFGQWLVFRRRFFSLMGSGVAMARRRFVFRTTA